MPESTRGRRGAELDESAGEAVTASSSQTRLLGLGNRRRRADPNPRHPASVEFGDSKPMAVDLDGLAELRQVSEFGHQETGDGLVRAFGQGDARLLSEVVGVEQPVNDDIATSQPVRATAFKVVFVADIADDFFDEVFKRDDARGAAVLVDDNREVLTFAPHF